MSIPPAWPFDIEAEGIRVRLDLGLGHISRFEVEREGRRVAPFHRAPWADDARPPAGTEGAPHLARISGDFFCAPFAACDVEPGPPHGWSANSPWRPIGVRPCANGICASFELEREILGARLLKMLTLKDNHPFLYQRHVFRGGAGALPVANHAMVRLPSGGRMSFSAKRRAETPGQALEDDPERGRSILAYPARTSELARFPTAEGGTVDLTTYPLAERHEDFVMLVEAEGARLGWTAVTRPAEADMALMLKNPAQLPVTLMWFSNGGRFYPPWSGRHRNVLGIEDGCTYSLNGHAASAADNPMTAEGIATAIRLAPDGEVEVRHVTGALPVPRGFGRVIGIEARSGLLCLKGEAGAVLEVPFDTDFL